VLVLVATASILTIATCQAEGKGSARTVSDGPHTPTAALHFCAQQAENRRSPHFFHRNHLVIPDVQQGAVGGELVVRLAARQEQLIAPEGRRKSAVASRISRSIDA